MMAAQPGWYPDPDDPSQMRWWDGAAWGASAPPPVPATDTAATPSPLQRIPLWGWAVMAAVAIALTILVPGLIAVVALVVLVVAIVALWRGTPTWLRLRTRKAAAGVAAIAAVVCFTTTGIASAQSAPPTSSLTAPALQTEHEPSDTRAPAESSAPRPFAPAAEKPTPTPTTSVREEVVTEVLPFAETTVDDPTMTRGQTAVRTEGANGERILTYRVTLVDGQEVGRELVSDVVTVPPTDRVVAVGTYDPPPPPRAPEPAPIAQAGAGCDSNYADACVPVSSDVDCAGGSGDGPAYFDGVARVVGSDVYGLDRNGDGYACEP